MSNIAFILHCVLGLEPISKSFRTSDNEDCNTIDWNIVNQQRRKRKKKDNSNPSLTEEELHGFANMEIELGQGTLKNIAITLIVHYQINPHKIHNKKAKLYQKKTNK